MSAMDMSLAAVRRHWRIYATMTLVLGLVATAAAAVPVRRATSIDPVTALRYE